jgi:uncharacterized protein (TIGR02588 family)
MSDEREERPPRTTAEWWTFAASVVLVGVVAGLIVLSWVTGPPGPALLEAGQSGPVVRTGSAYRVPFEVRNAGGEPANNVQVVAELVIDGTLEGEGEQSVMFLSAGESETGAFLFPADPSLGVVTISVASYSEP